MSATTLTPDDADQALKAKHRAMWALGDYHAVATEIIADLGPVLVDAKGVSRLYEGRIRRRDMVFLVASAIAAMVAMTWASHSLHVFLDGFRLTFSDTWSRITAWF